ncbi:unnamed protein product [Albugo candida]|uniref:Uncharacterized protein n=1 Tax=Albugo candida TaxID=65357 RepID=A0A024GT48_9STRA|nr:unnamed protein product [Albugo candida]|eukprot:CCI50122.1 unnamed protein product [Albugo candida]
MNNNTSSKDTNIVQRVKQMEAQLTHLSNSLAGSVESTELHQYKTDLLHRLRNIRDVMKVEHTESERTRNQLDQVTLERDTLLKQVSKLSYRIHHLQQNVTIQDSN